MGMHTVAELMLREVVSVSPSTTVAEAFDKMEHGPSRHLPVVEAGKLIGIVSDRDLLRHMPVVRGDESKDEHERYVRGPVSEVMTPAPLTVDVEQPVNAAVSLLLRGRVSALPVLDAAGRLLGLFTLLDAARAFMALDEEQVTPVSDLTRLRDRLDALS